MNRVKNFKNNNFRLNSSKFNRSFMSGVVSSNIFRIVGVLVLIFVVLVILNNITSEKNTNTQKADITEIGEPIAREEINRDFTFPIKDSSGTQLGEINYAITNVEIRDEIIIQGKKYVSVDGRTFVIVSLKVRNDFDQAIEVNSRNYVRLSTNGSGEWLAPDTHNDPVKVQAISTKPTRVAFTIDDNSENLILQVGEIKGEKELIELSIKP